MSRTSRLILSLIFCMVTPGFALAQGPGGPGGRGGFGGPPGPPMERAFHDHNFGRWWNDPKVAQQLGLSDDQKHRMDQIFLQHRLNLIDLDANLEKQQTLLEPMIQADQPDEAKILSQIDAIAQARADLEKANARMLFDLRKTLTPDQWKKLKTMREEHRSEMGRRRFDDRVGPDRWREHRQGAPDGQAPAGGPPQGPPDQSPAPPQ